MTGSTERGTFAEPFTAGWRDEVLRAQEAALPPGRVVVSCSAPIGGGGLGRHLREIADALDRRGQPRVCLCGVGSPQHPDVRELTRGWPQARLARLASPSPAWSAWSDSVAFDRRAARALPAADSVVAFNGQALSQLRAARASGRASLSLVAANAHLRHVVHRHARAYRQYPLERSWATRLLGRNLKEYARVERIYVASRYVWESFAQEGLEDRLSLLPLTPDPRYRPGPDPTPARDTFDVVYVGALTVTKGTPLLVEAFARVRRPDMRLMLVGGWSTRGMRRFLQGARARDPRIRILPGDPLAHLRAARLYVHPSYSDGFGYAPAEALACGVPVIVSADTGMKDLLGAVPGDSRVVPTGDLDALTEAIGAAYAGERLDR
jgi:glycosyltransferase involved in cell wall biosynthesis